MLKQNTLKKLAIRLIVADPKYQIREGLDPQRLRKYQETYSKTPKKIPPILVARINGKYYVVDGFHRLQAATNAGIQEIEVEICADNETDAMWIALGSNHDHGLPAAWKDKKKAVLIALKEFPDRNYAIISEHVHCSDSYVCRINKQYQVRTGSDLTEKTLGKDGKYHPRTKKKSTASVPKPLPKKEIKEKKQEVSSKQAKPAVTEIPSCIPEKSVEELFRKFKRDFESLPEQEATEYGCKVADYLICERFPLSWNEDSGKE